MWRDKCLYLNPFWHTSIPWGKGIANFHELLLIGKKEMKNLVIRKILIISTSKIKKLYIFSVNFFIYRRKIENKKNAAVITYSTVATRKLPKIIYWWIKLSKTTKENGNSRPNRNRKNRNHGITSPQLVKTEIVRI